MAKEVPEDSTVFHRLAKEAGNNLRGYVLSFSSAAAGVFFFTLTNNDVSHLSATERVLVGASLIFYFVAAILCLYELRLDAIRFFKVAKQLETPKDEQDWTEVNALKARRLSLIYSSYAAAFMGIVLTASYMGLRLTGGRDSPSAANTEMAKPAVKISQKVAPGYRGMSIQVPEWEGESISPGNRIDVIVTFPEGDPSRSKERSGRTLLQNVLVLDVQPQASSHASTLRLALNPNEAQYLALAIDEGRIHVTVRGYGDVERHPLVGPGFRKLFK